MIMQDRIESSHSFSHAPARDCVEAPNSPPGTGPQKPIPKMPEMPVLSRPLSRHLFAQLTGRTTVKAEGGPAQASPNTSQFRFELR